MKLPCNLDAGLKLPTRLASSLAFSCSHLLSISRSLFFSTIISVAFLFLFFSLSLSLSLSISPSLPLALSLFLSVPPASLSQCLSLMTFLLESSAGATA